jgi:hypothetical protein
MVYMTCVPLQRVCVIHLFSHCYPVKAVVQPRPFLFQAILNCDLISESRCNCLILHNPPVLFPV